METKAFPLSEVKASGQKGEFEALVSVQGNVDRVGDRVHPGAFAKALAEQAPPPVVWFHQWNIPPIGETIDWAETEKGMTIKGRLFVDDEDDHEYARMVYTAMKSREGRVPALRQFSFAYDVDVAENTFEKSERVRELKSLFPIHEVGPCLRGVNESAGLISAPKADNGFQQFNRIYVPNTWTDNTAGGTSTVSWTFEPKAEAPSPAPAPAPPNPPAPPAPEPVPPTPTPVAETKAIPAWRFPPQHATQPQIITAEATT